MVALTGLLSTAATLPVPVHPDLNSISSVPLTPATATEPSACVAV
jgi:hypothetical protein